MLNIPVLKFMETSAGQKMPVIMANLSGVSERTLRKSELSIKTVKKIEEASERNLREKLTEAGYTEQEANEYISNHPHSLYVGLIYGSQILGKMEFPRTIEFASRIDEISLNLFRARKQDNLEEFKRILLMSEVLDRRYYVFADDEWNSMVDPEALSQIKSAQDWIDIDKPFNVLIFNVLFSLMAHWDIEFYQQYFYAFEFGPRPLFSLLLPKLDPAAKYLDESTIAKRRGMFWFPIKRLIDLMGSLGHFKENTKWQDHVLKVSDIVRMIDLGGGEISEEKLVSWHDGTTRFMEKDFYEIWQRLCPDMIVPYPLFVAATMWQIYLTDIGTNKTILCFDDRYSWWWESNLAELANDLSLYSEKKVRWPACFGAI